MAVADPRRPAAECPASEFGRALRRLSDQIAASNHKPLSIDDVQRAARDAAAPD
jgi:hypothetical protein